MFTSRAEHRLLLSQNNAEQRLLDKAFKLGLVEEKRFKEFKKNEHNYKEFLKQLKTAKTNYFINNKNKKIKLTEKKSFTELLKRTDINPEKTYKPTKKNKNMFNRAKTEIKYSGYINKQQREIEKNKKQNNKKIPSSIKYKKIPGLSNEVIEKLNTVKPATVGQATQIEGITPAAINLILIQIKKKELQKHNA